MKLSVSYWGNPKCPCIIRAWCLLPAEACWWNGGLVWARSLWNLWRPESQTHPEPFCSWEQTWKGKRKEGVVYHHLLTTYEINGSYQQYVINLSYFLHVSDRLGLTVVPALCQAQQEFPVCRPEVLDFHDCLFNIDLSSLKEIFLLG